ncbi:hypothetical protein QGM71_19600 [Virgibacillus sp. C22-A2]|uniref:Uncharacterized protein n=1 Tax=Virgibacillus tibetensis TaxID=3042313 RepID=A0ABU6KKG7_9BACI|nr:hypothetical protein [Virgibacillus sp. C22-A2]
MVKRNRVSKLGWFGWTLISAALVTVIGSVLFYTNIMNLDLMSIIDRDESTQPTEEEVTEDTVKEIEKVQETVGKDHAEIGEFIAEMHRYYNKTTGYGGIRNLDWPDQIEKAEEVAATIDREKSTVTNDALLEDLETIQQLANTAISEQDASQVRDLHRLFHDLDIALNSYNGSDRIWNVTETLKRKN